MNLIDVLEKRYATKEFDTDKKIPAQDIEQIKALLQLSPNSVNLQPWHFLIAETEQGKQRVAKSTEAFPFNTSKVLEASHVVVFCSKTGVDDAYLAHVLAKEEADGRYPDPEFKDMMDGARKMFIDIHRYDYKDLPHWMEKQVYLNIGNLLLGAAILGIDALPMEGLDMKVLDQEFGLREQGLTAVCGVALGYRKNSDFNADLPKSRLAQTELFTAI